MTSNAYFILAAALALAPICLLLHWFLRSFILATVLTVILVIAAVMMGLYHIQHTYPAAYPYIFPYIHYKSIALYTALESIVLGIVILILKKCFQTSWYFYILGLLIVLAASAFCLYFAKKDAIYGFNHSELGNIWNETQPIQRTLKRTVDDVGKLIPKF